MRQSVSLYIAGRRADLNSDSFILTNYTTEDLYNPAVVKNSYTQQITLPGTPTNNAIFGASYRLDHTNGNGGSGPFFSAAYKTPFVLRADDGTVLQRGYVKLDNVIQKANAVSYKITLYGGLGSFLYDLAYDDAGNKRTLATLDYLGGGEDELDFTITAQAVEDAWAEDTEAGQPDSLWKVLNFAPAYNGIPDGNFEPGLAIGDPADYGLPTSVDGYSTRSGYALFKLAKDADEWAVKDFRSYLQRPVLSMRAFLKAIQKPGNNGGHTVTLRGLEDVAPFRGLWLTLPLLPSIGTVKKKSGALSLSEVTPSGSGVVGRLAVVGTVPSGTTMDVNLHMDLLANSSAGAAHLNLVGEGQQTVMFVQAVGYDANGGMVGGTPLRAYYTNPSEFNVVTPESLAQQCHYTPAFREYEATIRSTDTWDEHGSAYLFSEQLDLSFTAQNVARVDIVCKAMIMQDDGTIIDQGGNYIRLYKDNGDPVDTTQTAELDTGTVNYTTTDTLRSGTIITKSMLLSTSQTPADYLLALCKIFGLYIVYDEPTAQITIMPRQDFYNTGLPVVDITDRVDRSRDITVTPFAFNAKWYELALPDVGGAFAKEYQDTWGVRYGSQRINTGFDFNSDVNDIFRDVPLKSAATVLRNGRYWNIITDNAKHQPSVFVDKGNKYTLWNGDGETKEYDISCPSSAAAVDYYNTALPGYDKQGAAKLELASADNKAVDGQDILVLRDGSVTYEGFQLTDDTPLMDAINNGTPCWILSSDPWSQSVTVPLYRRYDFTGTEITGSMDFGVPRELNIPNVEYDPDCTMYAKYWQAYIRDRYHVDSKVMRCRVCWDGIVVNADLLRRFYFFRGAVWVLNRIINHSRLTWDATECEFVQVQDMANYTGGQDYDTSPEYENTDNGTDGEMTLTDPADTIRPSNPGTGTGGNSGGTGDPGSGDETEEPGAGDTPANPGDTPGGGDNPGGSDDPGTGEVIDDDPEGEELQN